MQLEVPVYGRPGTMYLYRYGTCTVTDNSQIPQIRMMDDNNVDDDDSNRDDDDDDDDDDAPIIEIIHRRDDRYNEDDHEDESVRLIIHESVGCVIAL